MTFGDNFANSKKSLETTGPLISNNLSSPHIHSFFFINTKHQA